VALVAFAAAIEGYLFTWIDPVSRVVMVPAVVAVFHPSLVVELIGAGILLALMGWNWLRARDTRRPAAGPVG
jgi:TRAP-type uncharacterized transport system fused permease subunit